MMPHRFAEQRARRVFVPGFEHEIAKIVQRPEIGRLAPQ